MSTLNIPSALSGWHPHPHNRKSNITGPPKGVLRLSVCRASTQTWPLIKGLVCCQDVSLALAQVLTSSATGAGGGCGLSVGLFHRFYAAAATLRLRNIVRLALGLQRLLLGRQPNLLNVRWKCLAAVQLPCEEQQWDRTESRPCSFYPTSTFVHHTYYNFCFFKCEIHINTRVLDGSPIPATLQLIICFFAHC